MRSYEKKGEGGLSLTRDKDNGIGRSKIISPEASCQAYRVDLIVEGKIAV